MNLSDLSKETQKKILFGLLAAILVIGVLYLIGLPLLRNRKAQKEELEDLTSKIKKANRMIDQQSELYSVLEAKTETLGMTYGQMLPPQDNRFVWATERMTDYARRCGIEIDSINEVRIKPPTWDEPPERNKEDRKNKRYFIPYQVKIDTECGYDALKKFIALIESENKYASISSLMISARQEDPERHNAAVTIEWPATKETAEKSISAIIDHGLLEKKGSVSR